MSLAVPGDSPFPVSRNATIRGLPVYLHVSPQKERATRSHMNKKQLCAFYERFGFHTVRGMEADYMDRG